MAPKPKLTKKRADEVIKAMQVLSRTVDHVLQTRVVEATKEQLSGSKLALLHLLAQQGAQTPTQIARFLGISKPGVTRICDAMLNDTLIRRDASKEDRRELEMKLTAHGKEVFQQVRDEQRHLILSALRHSDHDRYEDWIEVLHEMSVALAKADRAFKHFCMQCGAYSDDTCVLVGGNVSCLFLQNRKKFARKKPAAKKVTKKTVRKKAKAKASAPRPR